MNDDDEMSLCDRCATEYPIEEVNECLKCGMPVCDDCAVMHESECKPPMTAPAKKRKRGRKKSQ